MEDNKKIISRLDTIITLLVLILKKDDSLPKLSVLFYRLKKVGLTNQEISDIFGQTPSKVAKTAYEFKRAKTKRGRKKK